LAASDLVGHHNSFDLHSPVVLRKENDVQPFIISRRSPRELVEELAGRSLLYIWGGPMLALASLAYLIVEFTK
jgi:E3 Ubiquitin ligase